MLITVCSEASGIQEIASILHILVRNLNTKKWEIKVRNTREFAISVNFLEDQCQAVISEVKGEVLLLAPTTTKKSSHKLLDFLRFRCNICHFGCVAPLYLLKNVSG